MFAPQRSVLDEGSPSDGGLPLIDLHGFDEIHAKQQPQPHRQP